MSFFFNFQNFQIVVIKTFNRVLNGKPEHYN